MTTLHVIVATLIILICVLRYSTWKVEKKLHDIVAEHEQIMRDAENEKY
jgi:hypothetical protein